jgi:hypothetical protein
MNINNTEHLEDDFIRKLMKQTGNEKPSDDFTAKVMAAIPATEPVIVPIEKQPFKWWHMALLAAAFTGIGYLIFFFDLSGLFTNLDVQPAISLTNYVNMFSSIVSLFTDGFSKIEVTTMPLVIILATALLIAGDKLLKKRINMHAVMF